MSRNITTKLKAVFILSFALTFALSPVFFEGRTLIDLVQAQEAPESYREESEVLEPTQIQENIEDEIAVQEEVVAVEPELEINEPIVEEIPEEITETISNVKSDQLTKVNESTYFTTEPVTLNTTYVFPKNNKVTITFTSLPSSSARLSIREIILTKEEMKAVGAVSETAYEFETSMVNGTFKYNLTLPNPTNGDVGVKYSDERDSLNSAISVDKDENLSNGLISINGLDHFTVFVVVNPNPVGNGNSGSSDCSVVGIAGVCYDTIQTAINQAQLSVGPDTINIKNGTYNECLVVTGSDISFAGESEAGVIIDSNACPSYAFSVDNGGSINLQLQNISISNLTLIGGNSYGFKIAGVDNFSMNNITAQDSQRTNIDLNGVNVVTLNNITATGAVAGNGIGFTDVNNAAVSNITTSGNAWGGLAIYTYGRYYPLGSSNITVSGTNSFSETIKLYVQEGNYNDPLNPSPVNSLDTSAAGFTHFTKNETVAPSYEFYQTSELDAINYGLALPTPQDSFIVDVATNTFKMADGNTGNFTGAVYYTRAGNATDVATQVQINNVVDGTRFSLDGAAPITGTSAGIVNATYNRWRLLSAIAAGEYNVTVEVSVSGDWYNFVGSSTLYVLDIPSYTYITPSTSGLFFRPTDRFARVRMDDEFNQFESVTFYIYDTAISTADASYIASYQVNRADCDMAQAGNYAICDLVRDYSGVVTPLDEGKTYLVKISSDTYANNGVRLSHIPDPASYTFTIDATDPVVNSLAITDPAGPLYSDSVTLQANVTDNIAGVSQVRFFYAAPRISDGQCDPNETIIDTLTVTSTVGVDTYEATFDTSALNGTYCFFATARDNAANNSNPNSVNSKLSADFDNVNPTVGLVSVVTDFNPYVRGNGAGFQIRMNALDLNGIATCEYSLDNGATPWIPAIYNTTPAIDRCQANNVTAANGDVLEITMRATDNFGNSTVGTAIIRTADSTNPVVTAFTVNPSVGGFTTANPVLNFTITDNLSNINRCQYRYRVTGSGAAGWSTWTNGTLLSTGTSVSCLENIVGLTDGESYDFQVRGRDSVNHNSAASSINGLVVDANMTSTIFTSLVAVPNSFWNTAIDLDGISTDNLGVDYVELYYSTDNGANWILITSLDNAANNTPFNWSYDWTPAAEGEYDLQARGFDTLGNQLTADAFNVTYDVTIPTAVTPEWGYDSPVLGYVSNSGTGLVRHAVCGDVISDTNLYRGLWSESTDANGVVGYERDVTYQGTYIGTFNNATNYTGTFTPFQGTSANGGEGIYHVRIRAIDTAGNASIDDATWANKVVDGTWCQMQIDLSAPIITANTTASSVGPVNGTITAVIETSDDGRGDQNIQGLTATHGSITQVNALDSDTESFDWSFDTNSVGDGNYDVIFCGTDSNGLTGAGSSTTLPTVTGNECYTIQIIVDNTKPVANDLADASYEEESTIPDIEITANDTLDINQMCLTLLSSPIGSSSTLCLDDDSTVNTVYTWNLKDLANLLGYTTFDHNVLPIGTYEFEYYVTDTAGNQSDVYEYNLTVTNVLPVVSISTSPSDFTINQAITMTANISGNTKPGNQIASYSWGSGNFAGCTGTASTVVTPSAPGSYTCRVTVTDVDGDTATAVKTVVVTNSSPTVILVANSPATGGSGTVFAAANTNFTVSAITSNGDAPFDYLFTGTCAGNTNNTGTTFASNTMNLAAGTYSCIVTVTDNDGETALASVPIVVSAEEEEETTAEVLGTETTTTTVEVTSGSILGEQTCTETETLSGFVYFDKNNNGEMDSDEEGLARITISVFYRDDSNERKFLRSVETDSDGSYLFELCAGNYEIEVSQNDIEEGKVLSENIKNVTLSKDKDVQGINFDTTDTSNSNESVSQDNDFNWLFVIIPIIVLLVLILLYFAFRNRNEGENVDF